MPTIKQERKDLQMLLDGIDPITSPLSETLNISAPKTDAPITSPAVVDPTSTANLGVEPLFDYDYDGTRKGFRKRARKTVMKMVEHLLTPEQLNEDYIQDKIEQDIETLTDMYMQNSLNQVMQRALVTAVSRGNTAPRNFEVFNQLSGTIPNVNKQTLETEARIRRTYVDIKIEAEEKEAAMSESTAISQDKSMQHPSQGTIITSTADLIRSAKERHNADRLKQEEAKKKLEA